MQKRYRLLKRNDFQTVLKEGVKIFSRSLTCYYLENSSLKNIQIGIIVPKKKCKLAVKRSYLRRLFWALNTRREFSGLPKIKCLFFYKHSFFERFNNGEVNFSGLKKDFLKIMYEINKSLDAPK